VVDIDRGDVLFDVAALPSGRYLALGTTGHIQNPDGASISEAAQPLLVLLNTDGSVAQNLGYIGGARHNQLTTIASLNGRWLLGGMINGPGTHSGDAHRELIASPMDSCGRNPICQPSEPRLCRQGFLRRRDCSGLCLGWTVELWWDSKLGEPEGDKVVPSGALHAKIE
jgi:hypothetical protein